MKVKLLLLLAAYTATVLVAANVWAESPHNAAREGEIDRANQLIVAGANPGAIDEETALTPLVEATLGGHKDNGGAADRERRGTRRPGR